eukprot:4614117-Prymnesium_polylepis.1
MRVPIWQFFTEVVHILGARLSEAMAYAASGLCAPTSLLAVLGARRRRRAAPHCAHHSPAESPLIDTYLVPEAPRGT